MLMINAAKTRFFRRKEHEGIAGWLSPVERQMLYALAYWLPGPIVEIGPWCGLSTTAIARGIEDSRSCKSFDTFDLRLTPEHFRPMEDGSVGVFFEFDDVAHGVLTEEFYRKEILPVVNPPSSSEKVLRANLDRLGLSKCVQIHYGNFRDFVAFHCGFVFCDAIHDLNEVISNGPGLRCYLRSGSVLACHDVGGDQNLIKALREIVSLGHGVSVDSLYIAEAV